MTQSQPFARHDFQLVLERGLNNTVTNAHLREVITYPGTDKPFTENQVSQEHLADLLSLDQATKLVKGAFALVLHSELTTLRMFIQNP
ncbi:hypothetical protein D9M68_957590 [compost metagenome]